MLGTTNEGEKLNIKWQVTQVSRPLLSVSKLTAAGYTTNLHENGGSIKNHRTGKTIKVVKRHGIYVVDLWVPPKESKPTKPFSRPR